VAYLLMVRHRALRRARALAGNQWHLGDLA
jgi:hypothetical protein